MTSVHKNIFWLMLIQVSGYIFPLLMLPYLVRVFSPEGFGIYSIIIAVVQYAVLIVDFGFGFTAMRKISLSREIKKEVSKIFLSTIYAKLTIFLVLVFITFGGVYSAREHMYFNYVLAGSMTVLFNILFPIWYFQAVENVRTISIVTAISRACVFILIITMIKTPHDITLAIYINSLLYLFPAVFSLAYILKNKIITYQKITTTQVWNDTCEAFPLFISNMSTSLYTTLNTLILGKYTNNSIVGNYAAAERLRSAVQGLFLPVQQAVFPRASRLLTSPDGVKKVITIYGIPFVVVGIIAGLSFYFFGNFFISIYYGNGYELSGHLIKIMAPLLPLVALAMVVVNWILIALGENKLVGKIYFLYSILHLCYVFPLVKLYSAAGMVYSVMLTESLITLTMMYFVYKNTQYPREAK